MGYLTIDCGECGGHWHVYHATNWSDDITRTCPHCYAEIDPQTWENQVLPAFGSMSDANMELTRDHTGFSKPLFRVHYSEDQDMPDQTAGAVSVLLQRVDELEARLVEAIEMGGDNALAVAIMKGEI